MLNKLAELTIQCMKRYNFDKKYEFEINKQ